MASFTQDHHFLDVVGVIYEFIFSPLFFTSLSFIFQVFLAPAQS